MLLMRPQNSPMMLASIQLSPQMIPALNMNSLRISQKTSLIINLSFQSEMLSKLMEVVLSSIPSHLRLISLNQIRQTFKDLAFLQIKMELSRYFLLMKSSQILNGQFLRDVLLTQKIKLQISLRILIQMVLQLHLRISKTQMWPPILLHLPSKFSIRGILFLMKVN